MLGKIMRRFRSYLKLGGEGILLRPEKRGKAKVE